MAVVCALQPIPNQGAHTREDLFSMALARCSGLAAAFLRSLGLTRRLHVWRCIPNLFPARRGLGLCLLRKLLGVQRPGGML